MFAIQVALLLSSLNGFHSHFGLEFKKSFFQLNVKSKSTCFPGKYLLNKEYVEYDGNGYVLGTNVGHALPILLYLQSQEDGTKTLVCIFDWSDTQWEGECQWQVHILFTMNRYYNLTVKIAAGSAVNNTQFWLIQRADRLYTYLVADVIRVHPEPEVSLLIDNRKQNITDCVLLESVRDSILVEFCVKFLKNPSLSLYLENETLARLSVNQDCVKRIFHLASASSFPILAAYEDECCQFGSFSCLIKKEDVKGTPPPEESSIWPILFAPPILGTAILAFGGFLLYRKIISEREKAKKLKKLKKLKKADIKVKKDKQLVGAIFEVYTAPPEAIAEEDSDSSTSSS